MTDLKQRHGIDDTLCAVCGKNPATCINKTTVWLVDDGLDLRERMVRSAKGLPLIGGAEISIPTCGICYDQISNYACQVTGVGGGYDFREHYECNETFHDPESDVEGIPKGRLGDSEWIAYGCPNELCGQLMPGQLRDDTGTQRLGEVVFKSLLPERILQKFAE